MQDSYSAVSTFVPQPSSAPLRGFAIRPCITQPHSPHSKYLRTAEQNNPGATLRQTGGGRAQQRQRQRQQRTSTHKERIAPTQRISSKRPYKTWTQFTQGNDQFNRKRKEHTEHSHVPPPRPHCRPCPSAGKSSTRPAKNTLLFVPIRPPSLSRLGAFKFFCQFPLRDSRKRKHKPLRDLFFRSPDTPEAQSPHRRGLFPPTAKQKT